MNAQFICFCIVCMCTIVVQLFFLASRKNFLFFFFVFFLINDMMSRFTEEHGNKITRNYVNAFLQKGVYCKQKESAF